MIQNIDKIKAYYDLHLPGKLDGFLNGNERVELAWKSLIEYSKTPRKILEVGCGIGDIAWRMTHEWKNANVTGIDISPKSIEFARKVFSGPRLNFVEGVLPSKEISGPFDLIVMMDVFEHIAVPERPALYDCLKTILAADGTLFLSFPSPRHLDWLRDFHPQQIQPVDENIDLSVIMDVSRKINKQIILYKEVSVWYQGDYVHAIFSTNIWAPVSQKSAFEEKVLKSAGGSNEMKKSEKLKLLKLKLGVDYA